MTALPKPQKASQSRSERLTDRTPVTLESTSFDLRGCGVFFDEHIDLTDPVGSIFVNQVLRVLEMSESRERRRSVAATRAFTLRVRKILANAMRAYFFRTVPAVLYFAKADAAEYASKPNWMRHGELGKTIKLLEKAGFVERIKGKKMPFWSDTESWSSSYLPTPKLLFLSRRCRIHEGLVVSRLAGDELVQLFEPKGAKHFDRLKGALVQPRKGRPIQFEPTKETEGWTRNLEALASFYGAQTISLACSLDEIGEDKELNSSPCRKPETFRYQLYRVFNNGSIEKPTFEQGGRLFGGWWMQLAESVRQHITINGQPTVELDYANCHPRMLYHQRGLEVDGDLYSVPEVSALEVKNGVSPGFYRPFVKGLMQVLINGRGRPEATEDLVVPDGLCLATAAEWIKARHAPIADAFQTGAGLYLMRLESDIALEIITTSMEEEWVVLPVHDSFITTVDHEHDLRALMKESYTRRLGKEPVFK